VFALANRRLDMNDQEKQYQIEICHCLLSGKIAGVKCWSNGVMKKI
jgi:hypothetical protein